MGGKIALWADGAVPNWDATVGQQAPSIEYFPASGHGKGAACLVTPGGGYTYKEMVKEGSLIAEKLDEMGVAAFVLDYRVQPYGKGDALLDAQRAIRTIRARAAEFGIDPTKVGMIGFSAGGHLTGMCSVYGGDGDTASADPVERESSRLNYAIPCYGVLDFGALARGMDADEALRFSPTRHVSGDTPQTFLWHTYGDTMVPVSQSLGYADALAEAGVPFELHVYQNGPHGMGLAVGDESVSQWTVALNNWLRAISMA